MKGKVNSLTITSHKARLITTSVSRLLVAFGSNDIDLRMILLLIFTLDMTKYTICIMNKRFGQQAHAGLY